MPSRLVVYVAEVIVGVNVLPLRLNHAPSQHLQHQSRLEIRPNHAPNQHLQHQFRLEILVAATQLVQMNVLGIRNGVYLGDVIPVQILQSILIGAEGMESTEVQVASVPMTHVVPVGAVSSKKRLENLNRRRLLQLHVHHQQLPLAQQDRLRQLLQ